MIFSIAVNFNNTGNNEHIPFPSWSFARSPFWGDAVGCALCHPGCRWSLRWVSGCGRWDESEERGRCFSRRRESLCSGRCRALFVELGTMCSAGLQSFSWGVVAGVLESNRSLARDLKKKKKKLRRVSWFSLDCPGLPAPLELRSNCALKIRFRTVRPRSGLEEQKGKLRIQHDLGI